MIDANYLREWARRCHFLAQVAITPEVQHQLQDWAIKFDRDAEELERGSRGEPRGRTVPK